MAWIKTGALIKMIAAEKSGVKEIPTLQTPQNSKPNAITRGIRVFKALTTGISPT
jgi:hypothetical protein